MNEELQLRKLTPLPPQIGRAVYNQLPKARRWHQGSGDAVDRFARTTARLDKTPRLHRAWIVVPLSFNLPLINEQGHAISKTCYVLLMLDYDSALPIGLWTSSTPPGNDELRLVIYQSIWHPGKPDWILRGLPRNIYIPASLSTLLSDDLQRSLKAMLVTTKPFIDERRWRRKRIAVQCQTEGAEAIHYKYGMRAVTVREAHDVLLRKLHADAFTHDRPAPILNESKRPGLGMAAHDSSFAGWLLPRRGTIETIANGVRRGKGAYTSSYFQSEPGKMLHYREFPYSYSRTEQGLFVEQDGQLFYVKRTKTTTKE